MFFRSFAVSSAALAATLLFASSAANASPNPSLDDATEVFQIGTDLDASFDALDEAPLRAVAAELEARLSASESGQDFVRAYRRYGGLVAQAALRSREVEREFRLLEQRVLSAQADSSADEQRARRMAEECAAAPGSAQEAFEEARVRVAELARSGAIDPSTPEGEATRRELQLLMEAAYAENQVCTVYLRVANQLRDGDPYEFLLEEARRGVRLASSRYLASRAQARLLAAEADAAGMLVNQSAGVSQLREDLLALTTNLNGIEENPEARADYERAVRGFGLAGDGPSELTWEEILR